MTFDALPESEHYPIDWLVSPANEFCNEVTDGTHDSPKPRAEGFYLVTSKHIKGTSIDYDSAYLISEEDYQKVNRRSQVDQWDVIISMIGEYLWICISRVKSNYRLCD